MRKTRIVNCLREEFDVYIGRAGKGHDGTFGNPFKRGPGDPPGSTLIKFEEHFLKRVEADRAFREKVLALKGKRLGCFCPPKRVCHGLTYVRWLDGEPEQIEQMEFFA